MRGRSWPKSEAVVGPGLVLALGMLLASFQAGAAGAAPSHLAGGQGAWPQAAVPAAACRACGRNLIANPGAEVERGTTSDSVVKVPDWKGTGSFTAAQYAWSGGDLSATTPGPKDRGKNYFYGGPSALRSTGTQTVDLPAGSFGTGTAYVLAAWLGGYADQGDNCQLSAQFENAAGKSLGEAKIGPVTALQRHDESELLYRGVGGEVPAGTRQVVLTMVFILEVGGDNDGMADNLSLVLTPPR